MRFFTSLILGLICLNLQAKTGPQRNCDFEQFVKLHQAQLEPVTFSSRRGATFNSFSQVGVKVKNKKQLKKLLRRDGVYIYLIAKKGVVYVSHRVPDLSIDLSQLPPVKDKDTGIFEVFSDNKRIGEVGFNFFSTHLGLYQQFLADGGKHHQLLSMGEIRIFNRMANEFNNRTGRGKVDSKALKFAANVFTKLGVDLTQAKFKDYSQGNQEASSDHINIRARALAMIKYSNRDLVNRLRRIYSLLANEFPDPKKPGFVDEDILVKYVAYVTDLTFDSGNVRLAHFIDKGFQMIIQVEKYGIEMAAYNFERGHDDPKLKMLLTKSIEALEYVYHIRQALTSDEVQIDLD